MKYSKIIKYNINFVINRVINYFFIYEYFFLNFILIKNLKKIQNLLKLIKIFSKIYMTLIKCLFKYIIFIYYFYILKFS
jgi:hypothetical protein